MSAYEEQYITVSDDNGNETLYEVLFTFDSEDYGKSYILLIPAGSEPGDQVDVLAYSFDKNLSEGQCWHSLFLRSLNFAFAQWL